MAAGRVVGPPVVANPSSTARPPVPLLWQGLPTLPPRRPRVSSPKPQRRPAVPLPAGSGDPPEQSAPHRVVGPPDLASPTSTARPLSVARSPDRSPPADRRSPVPNPRGDLRSRSRRGQGVPRQQSAAGRVVGPPVVANPSSTARPPVPPRQGDRDADDRQASHHQRRGLGDRRRDDPDVGVAARIVDGIATRPADRDLAGVDHGLDRADPVGVTGILPAEVPVRRPPA